MYMSRVNCYECKYHENMKSYKDRKRMFSEYCNFKKIRLAGTHSFPKECDKFLHKDQQLLSEMIK